MSSSAVVIDRAVSDTALQLQQSHYTSTTRTSNNNTQLEMDVDNHHREYDDDDDTNDWFLINNIKNICRACRCIKSIRIDWSQGDRICTACGVVQEERIVDRNPEWRDYGDRDDHQNADNSYRRARCGMIPNNEMKYIGGLQPTTLSRTVYNGTNGVRSVRSKQGTSTNMVQRLRKVHCKIEHRIEQQNKLAMKNASLNLQLLRKRQKQDLERREAARVPTTTATDADTENTDTVTATLNDDDDTNDDDDDGTADVDTIGCPVVCNVSTRVVVFIGLSSANKSNDIKSLLNNGTSTSSMSGKDFALCFIFLFSPMSAASDMIENRFFLSVLSGFTSSCFRCCCDCFANCCIV